MTDHKPASDNAARPWFMNWVSETPPAWSALANVTSVAEPAVRSAARANLELSTLVAKRVQAYMGIAGTLSHCRSPLDVFEAQMAFWQVAGSHYADAARHVTEAWQGAFPAFGAGRGDAAPQPRDYITFPEPKAETGTPDERHPGGKRRAA